MKTENYRNIFLELGYPADQINTRVDQAFATMFEGPQDLRIFFEGPDDTGYMLDTGNNDARTEGMSYGMLMAVQFDRQDIFDRLWKWSMAHMYMHEGTHAGYFAWSCQTDGTKNAYGPAPDGEEYYALALFFAANRWGDRTEPFNYSHQARELLRSCIHKGEKNDGYPMWNPDNHLIKFIPDCEFTDPSYHLPHFYELFALWAYPEDREFWKKAAAASRAFIPTACHPQTGLNPEYSNYDGTPHPLNGHGNFYSDSYRVAANIGLDAEWFGAQDWHRTIAKNLLCFFAKQDPTDYRRYEIDGQPLEQKSLHPVGLIATNAMAALANDGPDAEKAVRLFWNTPLREGDRRYYDNCLYLFALLALSGRYKILT